MELAARDGAAVGQLDTRLGGGTDLHGEGLGGEGFAEAELAAAGLTPRVDAPVHRQRRAVRRARRDHRHRSPLQRREVARHIGRSRAAGAELALVAGAPGIDVAFGSEANAVRLAARHLRHGPRRERLHQPRLRAVGSVAVAELALRADAERVDLARVRERRDVLGAEGNLCEHPVQSAQLRHRRRLLRAWHRTPRNAFARQDQRAREASRHLEDVLAAQRFHEGGWRIVRRAEVGREQVAGPQRWLRWCGHRVLVIRALSP